jgi:hypothetical protein
MTNAEEDCLDIPVTPAHISPPLVVSPPRKKAQK